MAEDHGVVGSNPACPIKGFRKSFANKTFTKEMFIYQKKLINKIKRGYMKSILNRKKAAFELSMTTVVIIVIAMVMLILGLTLVRKVFETGTGFIDLADSGVRSKLNKMLGDEGRDITIGLADKTAKIVPGDDNAGSVPLVVETSGMAADPDELSYKVSLGNTGTCTKTAVNSFFITELDKSYKFDEWEGSAAYANILIKVPNNAKLCTQQFTVDVFAGTENLGRTSFTLKVVRGGFF